MIHALHNLALILGWAVIGLWFGGMTYLLGYWVYSCWKSLKRATPVSRYNAMNANAFIVARAREQGSMCVEEPDGTFTALVGIDEMGDLWPTDVR